MRIAILTDTNSGITAKEAADLGIFSMPMPVIIDETAHYEGLDLSEEELYDAMRAGKDVSTSQPAPKDLLDQWDVLLKEYDQVVYIPMSAGLSGSCITAQGLAQEYEGRVFVVDNRRISVTMRSSVEDAKRMADKGMSAPEIREQLEKTALDATIYLAVDSLEYLKKGGRISSTSAVVGGILKIKPILTIQGENIKLWSRIRGTMKKCQAELLKASMEDWKEKFSDCIPEQLRVGVAGAGLNETEIHEWIDMAREAFPRSRIYYDPLSASVGTHTGPGAVGIGVSFIRK